MSRPSTSDPARPDVRAIPLSPRSRVTLAVASVAGLMMLCWPLLVRVSADTASAGRIDPPFLFLLLLPWSSPSWSPR